jgi:plasmid stabilization system protein ParE
MSGTYEKSVSRLPYVIAYALTERAGAEDILILRVIHINGLKL